MVNAQALLEKGILSKCQYGVKILGNGNLTKKLHRPGFRLLRFREGEDRRGRWKVRGDLSDRNNPQRVEGP